MWRRLATLALVIPLILTGITACPARALSCPASMQASRDCCQQRALRAAGCCCRPERQAVHSFTGAATPRDGQSPLPIALAATVGSDGGSSSCTLEPVPGAGYGPAPPHTLFTQHTLLLS